ncbi:MAG: multifunctional oxoglutarate decarboxylase/oxoglutarate dehydrogenase thiamine pyrophosphate-binding subunit/dihydrolipoyllysine-residue succinyltransferase subunit [Candidatus Kapabacteria bacterium]|nr:multifunctional oxoglutarate decarboxylase/oxoglutarate dehydrogenase thiamine pyrophosphate-binding subunit/dihydrolipoyllysine-residue succinyltransferase subunit [Candidatus Kapabacteria bacterium]
MISPNSAFEEEQYYKFIQDPDSVSPEWQIYFTNLSKKAPDPTESMLDKLPFYKSSVISDKTENKQKEVLNLKQNEILEILAPIPAKISVNMEDSLDVPTATSVRTIPVKVLDENRRIINKYLVKLRRDKVSFTHVLLWAIVRGLMKYSKMNDCFTKVDGKPHRIIRSSINAGLAIDLKKNDGSRLLLVPNVKDAQNLNFSEFIIAFENIIDKARKNKLDLADLSDTSFTLTNPGMIGTSFSSPRLMKGQGIIIATGAIEYPVEFQAVRPDMLTSLAISKVVTMTCTYDHRIIQGAESAEFLAYINKLLLGEEHFYDQIFASLKIPFEPVRWAYDQSRTEGQSSDYHDYAEKSAHVMLMINAYRVRGHLLASINPLGQESYYYPELDPAYYGLTLWDLDRVFHCDDSWKSNNLPLRDIIELLRDTYCGKLGFEYMHIREPEIKEWLKKYLELKFTNISFNKEEKIHVINKLIDADTFENFLHTKFVGSKRFSLEGSEAVIVMLDKIFELAADSFMSSIVLGMAHRGRLNVLTNIFGKSPEKIFDEFEGKFDENSYHGSGDVKYHLGDEGNFKSLNGNIIPIRLASNPSHLELVNPVIEGMARALDSQESDTSFSKALPILIHGDAAFAGQGIVAETLNLSQLDGYKTGGTIHIIINNQIGFTTTAEASRSSIYATDIAKMIQVPIIHVNGDDPEAVLTATIFAYDYRNTFNTDIVIDMLSYRKYGHNEADEPTYTQPLLYKRIKSILPVKKLYELELVKEGVIDEDYVINYHKALLVQLNKAFSDRKSFSVSKESKLNKGNADIFNEVVTAVSKPVLEKITDAITRIPTGFAANPKVLSLLKKRAEMINSSKPAIDWAMGEALAFGTILLDSKTIRFSGQDSRRGTFSQRHAVITNIETEDEITLLNMIQEKQSKLELYDSPLSEMGVLGFEYGYSVISKDCLTLWEAQFGDFTNNAITIIDQFIACAETKWGQKSNIVLLLPHSFDGQGPEHSSARPERYLQLCAENNMFVANLSTPAQYFHILRRQVLMNEKKPLILITPKSMLRHPMAVSGVDEFVNENFQTIIDDKVENVLNIKKIVLCTGKIYYDILAAKQENHRNDVAIIRVEQLYPLDLDLLNKLINQYSNCVDLIWAQEEPQNMGAWTHICMNYSYESQSDIGNSLALKLRYIGRKASASVATGSYTTHLKEQSEIINKIYQ